MADSATKERLNILTANLSDCYDGDIMRLQLKCILFDHLAKGAITDPDLIGHDLFNKLEKKGSISPTNINLLLEITELIGDKKAKDLVKKYMNDNDTQNTFAPKLSSYRKRLFKAMENVSRGELRKVIAFYKIGRYNFTNIWDVVLHLEIDKQLEDEPEKIRKLAGCLRKTGKDILLGNDNTVQGMADDNNGKFQSLKAEISKYYVDGKKPRYLWLRFCLFEHLDEHDITNREFIGDDLLNSLERKGLISPTDVEFLLEITKVTRVKSAEKLVRRYMKVNKVQYSYENKLSSFRKRLFEAMIHTRHQQAFIKLIAKYYLEDYAFKNVWDIVLHLEMKSELEDTPEKIKAFADCLGKSARRDLFDNDNTVEVEPKGIPISRICGVLAFMVIALLICYILWLSFNKIYVFYQDTIIRNYLTAEQKNKFKDPNIRPPTWNVFSTYDISEMFTDPLLLL